jgi:hypothetical protein
MRLRSTLEEMCALGAQTRAMMLRGAHRQSGVDLQRKRSV